VKAVITGGGTGGHLAVAKAFARELKKNEIPAIYIGSTKGQDRGWFEKDNLFSQTFFLDSTGVVNQKGIKKLKALWQIGKETRKTFPILEKIDFVLSVGGFSAAPAALGAVAKKKPLFIHEQNAHIGSLNKVLMPFAKGFFSSFHKPYYPYPVCEEFFKTARIREGIETVIFLGGSQGASAINSFALEIAPLLKERGVKKIFHQTGTKEYQKVKEGYEKLGIEAEVFEFTNDLPTYLAKADFAISRAGAGTLWELCANNLPALLIPYPYAANDHQYKNALFFSLKGAALIRRQENLEASVVKEIFALPIKEMSLKLKELAKPNGAEVILKKILSTL